jgi:hypothetical protein
LCGKSQKLSAIETIEEFAIFAESLNVLRPPFELRRSPLILLDFLAALLALAVYSRAREARVEPPQHVVGHPRGDPSRVNLKVCGR